MEQCFLKLYKAYINDDPELTLTRFKTMSKLAKLVFVLLNSRPRYQVSVYRTIGPLVLLDVASDLYFDLEGSQILLTDFRTQQPTALEADALSLGLS